MAQGCCSDVEFQEESIAAKEAWVLEEERVEDSGRKSGVSKSGCEQGCS